MELLPNGREEGELRRKSHLGGGVRGPEEGKCPPCLPLVPAGARGLVPLFNEANYSTRQITL